MVPGFILYSTGFALIALLLYSFKFQKKSRKYPPGKYCILYFRCHSKVIQKCNYMMKRTNMTRISQIHGVCPSLVFCCHLEKKMHLKFQVYSKMHGPIFSVKLASEEWEKIQELYHNIMNIFSFTCEYHHILYPIMLLQRRY